MPSSKTDSENKRAAGKSRSSAKTTRSSAKTLPKRTAKSNAKSPAKSKSQKPKKTLDKNIVFDSFTNTNTNTNHTNSKKPDQRGGAKFNRNKGGRNRNDGGGKNRKDGKGPGKKAENMCDVIQEFNLGNKVEILDASSYKVYLEADEWYQMFQRVFDKDRISKLKDRAQGARIPMVPRNFVAQAEIMTTIVADARNKLSAKISLLQDKVQMDKERFRACDGSTGELTPEDEYMHRELFAKKKLCYRVDSIHKLLAARHMDLRAKAVQKLESMGYINPEVPAVFGSLEYSYTSTKFYATYYGPIPIVVPFRVSKPSSETATSFIIDEAIEVHQKNESTIVLTDSPPESFDDFNVTRLRTSRGTSKTSRFFGSSSPPLARYP